MIRGPISRAFVEVFDPRGRSLPSGSPVQVGELENLIPLGPRQGVFPTLVMTPRMSPLHASRSSGYDVAETCGQVQELLVDGTEWRFQAFEKDVEYPKNPVFEIPSSTARRQSDMRPSQELWAMPKIIMVVGLPGSGKTTLTCAFSRGGAKAIDDFRNGQVQWERFLGELRSGTDHVVNDPSLCDPVVRGRVERCLGEKIPGIQIVWVFLANDPNQCILNVLSDFWFDKRNDLEARLREIRRLSPIYHIPDGQPALPVGKSRNVFGGEPVDLPADNPVASPRKNSSV